MTLEHQCGSREQRLVTLEVWRQQSDIDGARKDEQFKHMDQRFTTLDTKIEGVNTILGTKIDAVNGTLSWIGKLIIGGIVMAILAFAVNGGLQIPKI